MSSVVDGFSFSLVGDFTKYFSMLPACAVKRNVFFFLSLTNRVSYKVVTHTDVEACVCVPSAKSSLKRPALFRTFCFDFSIVHIASSAVPLASKYRQTTDPSWPIRWALLSAWANVYFVGNRFCFLIGFNFIESLTLGFQSNSAKTTSCAAVSVIPELHAFSDKTATRHDSFVWKCAMCACE